RHDFDLPGRESGHHCADAELLDQDHGIGARVVGQDRYRMAAFEHLALDFAAPAAGEKAVAEAVADDLEEALVARGFFENFNVVGHAGTIMRFTAARNNVLRPPWLVSQFEQSIPYLNNFSPSF